MHKKKVIESQVENKIQTMSKRHLIIDIRIAPPFLSCLDLSCSVSFSLAPSLSLSLYLFLFKFNAVRRKSNFASRRSKIFVSFSVSVL